MENYHMPLFSHLETDAQSFLGDSEIILCDYFYRSKLAAFNDRIVMVLTDQYFCLCEGVKNREIGGNNLKITEICQIDFELKFEVMRETTSYDKERPGLGAICALKLEREGFQPVTLYSNLQTLTMWKTELEARLNIKGFHNLFKPIKKIGKGNFASVYLAERLEDKKMVAVKAFSKQATFAQQKGREALINEINLMRKMNQSNLMKLYGVYQSENSIYMTLELLEGDQLFHKIQSKHKFSPEQTKQIMGGLLRGLEHMHSKRIMHRDLKPENIMLRYSNSCEVVIVDFGLATWAEEQNYLFVRCGTPGYVAPQIINIRDLKTKSDPICDVFSVGLIFHLLLLGKSVFPGRTYNQVLNQNRSCDFNLDSYDYKTLPHQCHDLLKRMLDRNPLTRISAAEALTHSYFSSMEVEQPSDKINIINSPILRMSENRIDNRYPLQNKVSICNDLQALNGVSLKHANSIGMNKENEYGGIKRQYSSRVRG